MATSSPVALFNTDPNLQAQAALLQQRQALAQKLMEEGIKPIDTSNRTVGGVGYRISPMEGLAKMLQAYTGQKGVQDTTQQQAALAGQAYGALLNKYQPGSDPSYSDAQRQGAEQAGMDAGIGPPDPQKMAAALLGKQPAQGGQNPNNPNGIPAELIAGYTAGMIPKEVFEAQAARYKPTDATVQALQGGMDPTQANRTKFAFDTTDPKVRALQQAGFTPQQIYQTIAAEQAKAGTDPKVLSMQQAGFTQEQIYKAIYGEAAKAGDIERRPDQFFSNPLTGERGIVPAIPPGSNPVGAPGPNGAIAGVTPIPGAQAVQQANAQAAAMGTANGGFQSVTMPDGSQRPIRGAEVPALSPQAGVTGHFRGDPAKIAVSIAEIKDPQERANAQAALEEQIKREGNQVQLGQSTAAKVGVTGQMEGMQKRFSGLQDANTQAQTTSSYLRSIKDMAPVAVTGRFSDKLQYVNSLLAQVGNEKATDATTANNLLDKYSNQIVARLGQGGLGTDSARAILQSAYPNSHMTKEAIQEAADNLIGANEMTMAKARVLSPHGNANDPVSYQKKEQIFDQNADPRMWQYAAIKDPAARKQFLQKIIKNDPSFMQRAEQLHQIGAL